MAIIDALAVGASATPMDAINLHACEIGDGGGGKADSTQGVQKYVVG